MIPAEEMTHLETHALVLLLFSFALMTLVARLFGEVVRGWGQPAVLGEIAAGAVLGATVLGRIFPGAYQALFPRVGPSAVVFNTYTTQIAIILFILIASLEIDLGVMWQNRRRSMTIAALGLVAPFGTGFALGYLAAPWIGGKSGSHPLALGLFLGTALSISALPVIIKTLIDLGLLKTPMGAIVVSAAILDDFVGWLLFGVVSSFLGASGHAPGQSAVLMVLFAVSMLTVGRIVLDRALQHLEARAAGAGIILGVVVGLGLAGAAIADLIGVHAVFGAFLVGVTLGRSKHLPVSVRKSLEQFATFLFAPLFFASIALHIDFAKSFDPALTAVVFAVACIGKVVGCTFGARLTGVDRRTAVSIGFALNARGAMEIVLGRVALEMHIIDERMFVSLVAVALGTSALAGPVIRAALRLGRPVPRAEDSGSIPADAEAEHSVT